MLNRIQNLQNLVEKIEHAYDCEFNEGVDWAATFGKNDNKFFEELRDFIEENGYENITSEQEARLVAMSLKA